MNDNVQSLDPNGDSHPSPMPKYLPALVIAAIAFALYGCSMMGPPLFDDNGVFAEKTLDSMLNACRVPRRLVANLSFAANFYLHGDHVFGYHLVNVLCHVATSLGAFYLVMALPIADDRKRRMAWLAGLIMVAHPLATQGVSYMAQRYSCMSAMFGIWSLVSYCHVRRGGHRFWSILVFVFPILAVLTKEYVIVLPGLALALELLFFREEKQGRKRMLLGMGAMTLSVIVLAWSLFASVPNRAEAGPLPATKGPSVSDWTAGRVPRGVYARSQLVIIPKVYFRLAAVPIGQSVDHAFVAYGDWRLPVFLGGMALFVLLLSATLLYKKAPLVSFGLILFIFPIIPTSSIVPNTEFVAEHRAYLAVSGFSMAAAALLALLPTRTMVVVAVVYIGTLGGLTVNRNLLWNDGMALWLDAARKDGDLVARPWCGVGLEHFDNGDYAAAETCFLRSLEINPNYVPSRLHLAMAYEQQGKLLNAHKGYLELALEYPNRDDVIAHASRVLLKLGEPDKAITVAQQSLRLNGRNVDALLTLGQALERTGRHAEAGTVYKDLLQLRLNEEQRHVIQRMLLRIQSSMQKE